MKHIIILFCCTLVFIGCARQPLNVYSPHPINTVVVKEDGDAGINVAYFSNGPKTSGEDILHSNGIALQTRVVAVKNLFFESSISNLKENATRDIILSGNRNNTTYVSESNTTYNNFEIGIGKVFNLNTKKTSNFLLSAGYGKTSFGSNFMQNEGGILTNADFNFNNKHIYINTLFQLQFGIVMYQGGFKYNLTNFENVRTNNPSFYGSEVDILVRRNNNFRPFLQFYQDFGIVPSKKSPWLSLHFNFAINGRNNLDPSLRARGTSAGFSIMASPSKIVKRKK